MGSLLYFLLSVGFFRNAGGTPISALTVSTLVQNEVFIKILCNAFEYYNLGTLHINNVLVLIMKIFTN